MLKTTYQKVVSDCINARKQLGPLQVLYKTLNCQQPRIKFYITKRLKMLQALISILYVFGRTKLLSYYLKDNL